MGIHVRLAAWVMMLFCCAHTAQAAFTAGAAKANITPRDFKKIWIAGYGQNRAATGAHDDLWARCFHVQSGEEALTVITLDVVGFFYDDVVLVRKLLTPDGFKPERVVITSTHTHSGPDTLGLWGPKEGVPGRHEPYIKTLHQSVAACAREARKAQVPARLSFAAGPIHEVCHNVRDGDEYQQDHEARVMRLSRVGNNQPILTAVNYGCHPEVMQQKVLTADFPSVLITDLEKSTGGPVMFINGILGGMVTPKVTGETWAEMERVGHSLAAQISALLPSLSESVNPALTVGTVSFSQPVENARFIMAGAIGVFKRSTAGRRLDSEITFARLGAADFITIPGEALPAFGLRIKELLPGRFRFVLGLGNDELGYIMDNEVFDPSRYEESVSVGPQTGPSLYRLSKKLVQDTLKGKW